MALTRRPKTFPRINRRPQARPSIERRLAVSLKVAR